MFKSILKWRKRFYLPNEVNFEGILDDFSPKIDLEELFSNEAKNNSPFLEFTGEILDVGPKSFSKINHTTIREEFEDFFNFVDIGTEDISRDPYDARLYRALKDREFVR